MRKVSIRLPDHLIAAYDSADGNRSAVMRRRLSEAVADGEVKGVAEDLQTLAEVEVAKDRGRLPRRRATFKTRCHDFFSKLWESGAVTAENAGDLAESWHAEADVFGEEEVEFLTNIIEWWKANYDPNGHLPPFPDPPQFMPDTAATPERNGQYGGIVYELKSRRRLGESRGVAVQDLADDHDTAAVFDAAAEVWDG